MITRLVLRLPWFVSLPTVLAMAVAGAVLFALLANPYFKRTFTNDSLPAGFELGAVTAPAAPTAAAGLTPPGAVPSPVAPSSAATSSSGSAGAGAAAAPPPAAPAAATGPLLLREGQFVDGDPGHTGRGRARIIRGGDGAHLLRLEDFSVTNGPDLFVVLSTDPRGSRASAADNSARNLGELKATDGNLNYVIPSGVDVSAYHSVIIYCWAFRVVFAVATLNPVQ